MEARDIIYNDDVEFKDGDFKIDYSDQQHIEDIVIAEKGQYYESPKIGVGIREFQNASISKQDIKKAIRQSLEADNYSNIRVDITGNIDERKITVDAIRIK